MEYEIHELLMLLNPAFLSEPVIDDLEFANRYGYARNLTIGDVRDILVDKFSCTVDLYEISSDKNSDANIDIYIIVVSKNDETIIRHYGNIRNTSLFTYNDTLKYYDRVD